MQKMYKEYTFLFLIIDDFFWGRTLFKTIARYPNLKGRIIDCLLNNSYITLQIISQNFTQN